MFRCGAMVKVLPLLLVCTFISTGCVMKYKNNRYDLETVTVSIGTGTFLPGANIVSTYKRAEVPAEDGGAHQGE